LLTRQYPFAPEVVVLADEGGEDRRGLSVALALADVLRLPRRETIYRRGDENWHADAPDQVVNQHMVDTVKACRSLVVGHVIVGQASTRTGWPST
jgi:hypothetical protein